MTRRLLTVLLCMLALTVGRVSAQAIRISIDAAAEGKEISRDLIGIFYEDLSHAADGGLYAELVQNRSFEYSMADHEGWYALTGWEFVRRDGGDGRLLVDTSAPVHPNNPHYAVLGVRHGQGSVGLSNAGFDGIVIREGERYRFSIFARQLAYPGGPLSVRLEAPDGTLLGGAELPTLTASWTKYEAMIEATGSSDDARLVVLASHPGRIGLDMISLFPEKTFKGRENGLRADLAQVIADLQPKFVRFPGGCLAHGDGLDNLYRWKDTIGPVEQRKAQRNIWNYHQTLGLGYYEYFLFCEDLGAMPIPVVPAGVSCQNSGASVSGRYGFGQQCIPMEEMPAYIQEVLDLIEFANGPVTSVWGAKRAEMGHPEPFNLKYLGVGNEDKITPEFEERFQMIYEAVSEKYPEIVVIGTVGPFPDLNDEDYRKGWALADRLGLAMVDEHGYKPPQWFWDNLERYDQYDRSRAQVYLGEYAAHDRDRRTTLRSALAEAAYLTSLERNGDIVRFSSYAPLLARHGRVNWNPDLIYFDKTAVYPTIGYHVQRLFSVHGGDRWLSADIERPDGVTHFAMSTVRDSESGDLIIKLVNGEATERPVEIRLDNLGAQSTRATRIVLAGEADAINDRSTGEPVLPVESQVEVGPSISYTMPANSLTIFRLER